MQGASLGARLSKRRWELGLSRAEAAALIEADWKSLMWWERDVRIPGDQFFPAMIRYLGCEPWPEPPTLSEALVAERRRRGLPVKTAARHLGVDESSWESRAWKPTRRTLGKIQDFLGFCPHERFPADVR
jgi:hypothetical protein